MQQAFTADLAVTKVDVPDPVVLNQPLTYTVTVTNNGPLTATGVSVTDSLLQNVTFVSATPSQGTCSGTSTISCDLGTLANGATATVTIVVTPTTAGGVSNTAQVSGTEPDPNTANNEATATTTIISPDADGDGYSMAEGDCNDADAAIHPGATEVCNEVDDNCDGQIDEGVQSTFYQDADSDGFGNLAMSTQACTAPAGHVTNSSDCNDANAAIHPGATEVCDGVDNNCNGLVDEGVQSTFYPDADNDEFGAAGSSTQACTLPSGYVTDNTDCNDTSGAIHSGATDICGNGIDEDCSGADAVCPPPSFTVVAPNGGESWAIGSTQIIRWNPTGVNGNVKIELSRNGGATWKTLVMKTPNDGTESWSVTSPVTTQARIRISSVTNPAISDISDASFTLGGGSLTVVVPNGGEIWTIGSTQMIQWTATGITGNVKIELSRDGGQTWKTLVNSTPNDGTEQWKVTKPATTQGRIRIRSVLDSGAVDTSNGSFTIQ